MMGQNELHPSAESNTAKSRRRYLAEIYELKDGKHRILPMEGLRGFAVLLVFFVHYDSLFTTYASPTSVTSMLSRFAGLIGNSGVDLFFVLSGFLIYGMAIRKPVSYVLFIGRRAKRIYPTFLAVLGVYLLLSAVMPQKSKLPVDLTDALIYVLQNILFLPGLFAIPPILTVAWSLSYEFFFYLTAPLLIMVLRMHRWPGALRVAFFSAVAMAFLAHGWFAPHPHLRLVMFIAGILLYEVLHMRSGQPGISRAGEILTITLVLVSFAAICVSREHPALRSTFDTPGARSLLWALAFSASYFAVSVCAFGRDGLLARGFSWTPLRWLGNMSYSYYLVHGLALNGVALVAHRGLPPGESGALLFWALLLPAFFATLVVSTALFVTVERPFSLRVAAPAPRVSSWARRCAYRVSYMFSWSVSVEERRAVVSDADRT